MRYFPTMRVSDVWGSGWYGAPRGTYKHHGIDLIAYPGAPIITPVDGVFSHYGYPYDPSHPRKGHLRYVQITTEDDLCFRFFYVSTTLEIPDVCEPTGLLVGDEVTAGQCIGHAQGLWDVYDSKMVNHVHFEVKKGSIYLDPADFV